ncbi:hypothetical protein LCGC14_2684820, partial [marine sediment metagenome]
LLGSEATQELFGIILAVGAEARSGGSDRAFVGR